MSLSQQIVPYNSASSGKSLTVEFRPSGKSFIDIKTSSGPKTVPWGTPDVVTTGAEDSPPITTDWVRCVRNDSNQLCNGPFHQGQNSDKILSLNTIIDRNSIY